MCSETPNASPKREAIQVFPARINDGHCSRCAADLTELCQKVVRDEIPAPNFCPECRAPFRQSDLGDVGYWRCGDPDCHTEIQWGQKYCQNCGAELVYPAAAEPSS